MPFNFRSQTERTHGDTDQLYSTFGENLFESFAQGASESLLANGYKMSKRFLSGALLTDEEEQARYGDLITPEEANQRYGNTGVKFTDPIRDGFARELSEERRRHNNRQRRIEAYRGGLASKVAGFGAHMLGTVANPVDLAATVYFPSLRNVQLAGKAKNLAGAAKAIKDSKPLTGTFADVKEAVWQGIAGNASIEVFNFAEQRRLQTGYTADQFALGMFAGGALGAGLATAGRLIHKRVFQEAFDEGVGIATKELAGLSDAEAERAFMGMVDARLRARPYKLENDIKLSEAHNLKLAEIEAVHARLANVPGDQVIRMDGTVNENQLLAIVGHNARAKGGEFADKTYKLAAMIMKSPEAEDMLKDLARAHGLVYRKDTVELPSMASERGLQRGEATAKVLKDNPDARVITDFNVGQPTPGGMRALPRKVRVSKTGKIIDEATNSELPPSTIRRVVDKDGNELANIDRLTDPLSTSKPYLDDIQERFESYKEGHFKQILDDLKAEQENVDGRTKLEEQELSEEIQRSTKFSEARQAPEAVDLDAPDADAQLTKAKAKVDDETNQIMASFSDELKERIAKEGGEEVPDIGFENVVACLARGPR